MPVINELPAEAVGPPPGPPPGSASASAAAKPPPKQHDWESVVPDTSLFPPPPDIFSGFERSPTSNATEADAQAGTAWCVQHPLSAPSELDSASLGALEYHNIRLLAAPGFRGSLAWAAGAWECRTPASAPDTCILGYPPLYAVKYHSPLATGRPATAYYEVRVRRDGTPHKDIALALGFAALPYPSFRMPGWHRGSLAVHGDDGHKYVNDMWGGRSFTAPFRQGETYGIGMRFVQAAGAGGIEVEIFFTRNGAIAGSWDLHEETDAQEDLPVTGLEGFHDLTCAIGAFHNVNFEVIFDPERFLYKGG